MNPSDPIPLRDAVAEFSRDLGMPAPEVVEAVAAAWPEVVGATLAQHAKLRTVRDGVATIEVDDPAWATEFRYRESEVVSRLVEACGRPAVTALKVVVKRA